MNQTIEIHPFQPYIPQDAQILMLGTFPPKSEKWSMEFFYPNWINDMWRIMGNIFYKDTSYFIVSGQKKFDLNKIKVFLNQVGLGLFDTGVKVIRQKGNASDKYLDIVEYINLTQILNENPSISSIVTTGEKAASVIAEISHSHLPKMGECTTIEYGNRTLKHFRMPSSSRAYPMNIEKKSHYYATMFAANSIQL